jgi:hypothetical protein
VGQPKACRQDDRGDEQSRDRAAAASIPFRIGHDLIGSKTAGPQIGAASPLRKTRQIKSATLANFRFTGWE